MRSLVYLSLYLHLIYSCEYTQKFTECFNNHMAVKLSPQNCKDSEPKLITNLPCNTSCESGTFLSYSLTSNSLECRACPLNTYSLGGGTEYSSWNSLESFSTYCWIFSPRGWLLNVNCTTWHSNSDSFLVSGSSEYSSWYEADLAFYPTLVKPGRLEIIYRAEAAPISALDCEFVVLVDHDQVYSKASGFNPEWHTVDIELTEGAHAILISFVSFQTNITSKAIIKTIRITGSKFADFECSECESKKFDNKQWCVSCGLGNYLNDTKCELCPAGTISNSGSNSIEDCKKAENCTESDYHFYYSQCSGGVQKKIYEWNEILLCSSLGLMLPENQVVECLPCGPGEMLFNGICESCPDGFYSDGKECQICPAGKYAPKVKEINFWTPFPLGFETFCISDHHRCENDWESRGDYLVTSSIYVENSRIILQKMVEVIESDASVKFLAEIRGTGTTLGLLINGVNVYNHTSRFKESQEFNLNLGENILKWVCYHGSSLNEMCSIYKISFKGLAEGGADKCIDCPDGLVSKQASEKCTKCNPGMSSNANHTECIPCGSGKFTDKRGICKNCLENLIPSSDNRSCVVNQSELLTLNGTSFNISYFAGGDKNKPAYCEDKENHCFKSFYGSVDVAESVFYLSAFNPSTVDMPEFPQISNEKAYAFGILHTNESPIHSSVLKQKESDCLGNSSRIIVNLGSEVTKLSKFYVNNLTGFEVVYTNGDLCMDDERFSTKIFFICSKDEKEGWPVHIKTDTCGFVFQWLTVYACRICKDEDWIVHKEACDGGYRRVVKTAAAYCVGKENVNIVEEFEKCKNDHLSSLFIIIAGLISIVLSFAVIILYSIVYNRRQEQMKLVSKIAMTDPGVESERADN